MTNPGWPGDDTRTKMPACAPHPDLNGLSPIAKLAALHAETRLTMHLVNLVGRSLVATGALMLIAGFTLFAGMESPSACLTWAGLLALGMVSAVWNYRAASAAPFERESLEIHAHNLPPIALYCGFAWGTGAYLALPADTSLIGCAFFVAAPALAMAALLRDIRSVLAFVAPLLVLSSFAALLRPFPDGALAAAIMLITGALIAAGAALLAHRQAGSRILPYFPSFAA